jgi:hypothetical protein
MIPIRCNTCRDKAQVQMAFAMLQLAMSSKQNCAFIFGEDQEIKWAILIHYQI